MTGRIAAEIARTNFVKGFIMIQTDTYFLACIPDQVINGNHKDFADEQIKDISGDYKIHPNLDRKFITTGENVLLY